MAIIITVPYHLQTEANLARFGYRWSVVGPSFDTIRIDAVGDHPVPDFLRDACFQLEAAEYHGGFPKPSWVTIVCGLKGEPLDAESHTIGINWTAQAFYLIKHSFHTLTYDSATTFLTIRKHGLRFVYQPLRGRNQASKIVYETEDLIFDKQIAELDSDTKNLFSKALLALMEKVATPWDYCYFDYEDEDHPVEQVQSLFHI